MATVGSYGGLFLRSKVLLYGVEARTAKLTALNLEKEFEIEGGGGTREIQGLLRARWHPGHSALSGCSALTGYTALTGYSALRVKALLSP